MKAVELTGKKVSVIGAERSGMAAAELLKKANATVLVSDVGSGERTRNHIAELQTKGIDGEFGGHSERVYDCSFMVISPGVPLNAPVIVEAQKRGINVTAEVEVASWFCQGSIIAITGSNGKTTTTTLLGRMLSDAKKKHVVAGNIGTAFSSVVLDVDQETTVVLEVSSFQLDLVSTFRPNVAMILNITQNHMDRYDHSMQKYADAKGRIFMNQTPDDILIVNASDEWTVHTATAATSRVLEFSSKKAVPRGAYVENGMLKVHLADADYSLIAVDEISIKGEHNLQNAMAASMAALLAGVGPAYIKATLRNFKGVEHRQEFVRSVNGVTYINNSKATTVEAVEMALRSYSEPIVLIMGGKDKGNDYSTIDRLVQNKVKGIVATGYSAETIVRHFSTIVPVEKVETQGTAIPNIESMKTAVIVATRMAQPGDVVLLAPACTSFDWFTDYEERGRIFKNVVYQL